MRPEVAAAGSVFQCQFQAFYFLDRFYEGGVLLVRSRVLEVEHYGLALPVQGHVFGCYSEGAEELFNLLHILV